MVSIVDNDTVVATPNLFVRDVVVDEKAGTASFVVMLGGAAGQTGSNTVSVDYATGNGTAVAGSDYVAKSGTLVFAPGETVKTVVVNITDDATAEGVERFNLVLSNASGATIVDGLGVAEIGTSDATAVALPLISVADGVVGEGDGYVDLVVRLSAPGQNVVTVNYTTDFGSATATGYDYETANGTLTFAIGETTKIVRVELSEDTTAEQLEHFRLNLSAVHNATLAKATAMVSIVNNDTVVATPNLFVRDVVVDEKAGTASFVVMLGGAAGQTGTNTLSVDYATSNGTAVAGSDYVAKSGTLVFAPGESVKTVVVDITDDALAEGLERFNLDLSNASGATIMDGLGVAEIGASDATAVALPLISVADVVVGEGDGYVDLVVRLSAPGQNVVTVNYATDFGSARAFGSDYESANGTLTFAIGETTKTVRVELSEDAVAEDPEYFRLNLSAVHNATLGNTFSTVTIVNNGVLPADDYAVSMATTVSEAAGTASFTITRSGLLPAETVYVSTAQTEGTLNIGDYSGKLNEALSFAAGQTSRTVTVSITNDTVLENDETFGFVVQRNASDLLNTYLAKLTFTIHSDDGKTLDDYSSTISTTGTITAGQTKQGTINFIGDTDWFKTSLVAGTDYQFELKGASSGSGTLTDPFLRLRDSAGNPVALAFADDGGTGFDSRFTFTPLTDGTYFLAAGTGYHENGMGTYALTQSVRSNAAGTSYKLTPPLPAVGEASGSLTFTLTRSGVLPSETVFASTVFGLKNGYADNTGNSDYTGLNNLGISFAAGQPSKTFSINIHEDALAEGNETFGVIIQAAPDPSINNWLARSSFTILDNEAGQSSFRLSPLELVGDEASGHISVTLTRPAGLAQETVYVSTGAQPSGPANDDDYLELNQYPLTFGQNQEEQTFDIQLLTDNVSEPGQKFNLSVWRSADQNPQDLILRSPFTIVDADDPTRLPDAKTIFFNHKGMAGVLADLMFAAYDFKDSAKIAETFNGLKIEALDLGNLAGYRRNGDQPTGVFVNDNASAIVGRSSDAIFLSFTGTDDLLACRLDRLAGCEIIIITCSMILLRPSMTTRALSESSIFT